MSDESSEHLAPVSYLPWATPAGEAQRASPVSRAEPEESSAPEAAAERPQRREFGGQSRLSRRSRLAAVGDDDERTESESGAERDERIDRLVVSRLRRSALSITEVRSVLVEHGLDEVEIEEWIERYERLGYLDDARLAEQVVHSHGARRGKGSGAIMQELGRRGVDPTAARAAVDELDPEVERENAHAVAERRARQLTGLDRKTAERRLSAFLQRRGYPGDVVREAVSSALAAPGS
ncbi:regulatory protein RecX [Agromyces albus]|nr:regulatory protein RecX [Agromyces albus]